MVSNRSLKATQDKLDVFFSIDLFDNGEYLLLYDINRSREIFQIGSFRSLTLTSWMKRIT